MDTEFPSPTYVMQSSEKSDMLDKMNPDLIIEVIRNKLMGLEFIEGKWVKVEALQNRALTPMGAWDIANLMLPASSRNISISKLKDDEIRARTLNICKQAQIMCLNNWKEYGIKTTDQLGFVHQIVFTNTFITLKQPQDEGIRKLIMGTTSESRNVNTISEQKQGGFRGLFRR